MANEAMAEVDITGFSSEINSIVGSSGRPIRRNDRTDESADQEREQSRK